MPQRLCKTINHVERIKSTRKITKQTDCEIYAHRSHGKESHKP